MHGPDTRAHHCLSTVRLSWGHSPKALHTIVDWVQNPQPLNNFCDFFTKQWPLFNLFAENYKMSWISFVLKISEIDLEFNNQLQLLLY